MKEGVLNNCTPKDFLCIFTRKFLINKNLSKYYKLMKIKCNICNKQNNLLIKLLVKLETLIFLYF